MSEEVILFLDPDFPLEDVQEIGGRLLASGALVPGYIPAPIGFLDVSALVFSEKIENLSTILIPDRNIASRMARVATQENYPLDHPVTQVAVQLMAFAQAMNLDIDPGIAFHELAHRDGNQTAHHELKWFRAADRGNARPWIELALGRARNVDLGHAEALETHDLAYPPNRWDRNYIVAMKIAELARSRLRPVERMIALLNWMIDDFILAGPAVIFAARYFATHSARGGMIKHVKSPDREKAVAGARNAAWDIAYLSEFIRLIPAGERTGKRYILATCDRALAEAAPLLLLGPEPNEDQPSLGAALAAWWSKRDARTISDHFFACIERVGPGRARGSDLPGDPIAEMIAAGEAGTRAWQPAPAIAPTERAGA